MVRELRGRKLRERILHQCRLLLRILSSADANEHHTGHRCGPTLAEDEIAEVEIDGEKQQVIPNRSD